MTTDDRPLVDDLSRFSRDELERIVLDVQSVLWLDLNDDRDTWDPDKEWDSETIEFVAEVLARHGLRPDDKHDA
jgi:hypothetical protein